MFKRFAVLAMLFAASACTNSGQIERLEGTLIIPKSEFSYQYAFVSSQQPDYFTLFNTKEVRQFLISDLLMKKGYLVGKESLSLTTDKAVKAKQSLLVECGFSKNGLYGLLKKQDGGNGQTVTCGAYDMFDGVKIYDGVADVIPDAFSSVDKMSDQGIRMALSKLEPAGEGPGRIMTEAEAFALIRKR